VTFTSTWRTALRVASREARRSKGRSTLVVAMIALPVLCLSFAAVSYDMFHLTPAEKADRTMGAADARVIWAQQGPVEQDVTGENFWMVNPDDKQKTDKGASAAPTTADLLAKLPAGSTAVPMRRGVVDMRTANGIGQPNAVALDAESPLARGLVEITAGRAPHGPAEVALTTQAVARLGAGLGGTVTSGDGKRLYTVVGLVEFPSMLEQVILFGPVADPAPAGMALNNGWLIDTPAPVGWSQVRALNAFGIAVASRDVYLNPPPADQVANPGAIGSVSTRDLALGVLVAGLGLLEVVLLAGPAFAVSARRRQRQLALVAANGGTPAHIRRMVLADGVVLGLAGAVVGIVGGIASAFLARPYIEDLLAHARAGGYRVYPQALIAVAGLAVVTGVLAALVPAFITARQNVVAALGGRRGVTRSRKRWIALGVAMVALGTAIVSGGIYNISSNVMLAGLVIGELGMVLCTPALVGLVARLGRVLPLAPRIALRDAARNRAAAAPAISAVMAAVAGSVAIGLYFDSNREMQLQYQWQSLPVGYASVYIGDKTADSAVDPLAVEQTLRSTLPVTQVRTISTVTCAQPDPNRYCYMQVEIAPANVCPFVDPTNGQPRHDLTVAQMRAARADRRCEDANRDPAGNIFVDDGGALPVLTDAGADDIAAATAMLRAGGIVVRDARFIQDGRATISVANATPDPGVDLQSLAVRSSVPAYLLRSGVRGAATIIPTSLVTSHGLAAAPGMMVAATSRPPTQAEEDRFRARLDDLKVGGNIEHGPQVLIPIETWLILGAAALITIGAAAIGTGLAAADGRADLSTLAAVGASPRMRRGLSVSQTAVIAGLGSLLGAIAGLGAALAIMLAMNLRYVDLWPSPQDMPIAVPWLNLAASLLVVPLIAVAGAGLLTRSRLPIERRL
jgi:putative ABC transport system permease protein